MYASSTLDGLLGYGDFFHFFQLGQLPGWPYINYWIEFPPVFAFIIKIFYIVSGGQEHVFYYLTAILLLLADCGNLYFFYRVDQLIQQNHRISWRVWFYFVLLLSFPYQWWYFDSLAILFMLTGVFYVLKGNRLRSGLAIGFGFLVKFFPVMALVVLWRHSSFRRILVQIGMVILISVAVYGMLWIISPDFTLASIQSQPNKGSWETIWALLDGNYQTGNFGSIYENSDPAMAAVMRRNPAKIPAWITLMFFGAIGLWGLFKCKPQTAKQRIAILGWTWSLFLIWSPGYSPQWVLYLIPIILLVLSSRYALLMVPVMVFANLVEWPLLLSRGFFWALNFTIPLRFLLMILLAYLFLNIMVPGHTRQDGGQKAQEMKPSA